MPKVTIPNVGSGYLSTTAINSAFDSIEAELNNKVLYRNNPIGQANHMENDLDMNSHRIANVGRAISNSDALNYGQFLEIANTTENLTGVVPITWEFVSTGATSYSIPLASTNAVDMYIITSNGITIPPSSYTVNISTQTISFLADVPANGAEIVVRLFGKIPEATSTSINFSGLKQSAIFPIVTDETVFTTSFILESASTDVYLNGSKLVITTDYIIAGTVVTLTSAASAGDTLEVVTYTSVAAISDDLVATLAAKTAAELAASQAAQSALDAAVAAQGGGFTWTTKTTTYTAASFDALFVDTSGAGFTIHLPPAPTAGDRVIFIDVTGSFATNNLTVGRNGLKIMGLSEDMIVATNNAAFELIYSDATNGWRIF